MTDGGFVLIPKKEAGYEKVIAGAKSNVVEDKYKNRVNVIRELVMTEKQYVSHLASVVEVFVMPLKSKNIIPAKDLFSIFSNVQLLLNVNRELLGSLEAELGKDVKEQKVGPIFFKMADYLKMYNQYCGNQTKALNTIEELKRSNKQFLQFLDECMQDQRTSGQPLNSYLIQPIQRICRYPLLLKQLLKDTTDDHPDYLELEAGLAKVSEVVAEVNESQRKGENIQKISEIASMLEQNDKQSIRLVEPARKYIREAKFTKAQTGKIYQCYLFNDLFLICKPVPNKSTMTVKAAMYLDKSEAVDLPDAGTTRNTFEIGPRDGLSKKYLIKADNSETKQLWLRDIITATAEIEKKRQEFTRPQAKQSDMMEKKKGELSDLMAKLNATPDDHRAKANAELSSEMTERRKEIALLQQLRQLRTEREILLAFLEEEERIKALRAKVRREKKARKRAVEERLRAQEELRKALDRRDETNELNVDWKNASAQSSSNIWKKPFATEFYDSFETIRLQAVNLGIRYEIPEVVLVGLSGHGKSSLVEALTGVPINLIGQGVTKRVIRFVFLYNPLCDDARITIKSDPSLGAKNDLVVTQSALSEELAQRCRNPGNTPVVVVYESKYTLDYVIIDTPGFVIPSAGPVEGGASGELHSLGLPEEFLLYELLPSHRLIVLVEESQPFRTEHTLRDLIFKADPHLERTIFVYTKFFVQLSLLQSDFEVSTALSLPYPNAKAFFVSLLSEQTRASSIKNSKFTDRLIQLDARDVTKLDQFSYDKGYERSIGNRNLASYVQHYVWKNYWDLIFLISDTSLTNTAKLTAKYTQLKSLISTSEKDLSGPQKIQKLRKIASDYVSAFISGFKKMIDGSWGDIDDEREDVQSLFVLNSRLVDERQQWGHHVFQLGSSNGGSQLQSLAFKFREVARSLQIELDLFDKKYSSTYMRKTSDIFCRAVDLAQIKLKSLFEPIMEQLIIRGMMIIQLIGDRTEETLRNNGEYYLLIHSPPLSLYVKELFFRLVKNLADSCRDKCLKELQKDQLAYLTVVKGFGGGVMTGQLTTNQPPNNNKTLLTMDHIFRAIEGFDPAPTKDSSNGKRSDGGKDDGAEMEAVVSLATNLFGEVRERLTRNVLLKFQENFVVPVAVSQSEIINHMQTEIGQLDGSNLERLFDVDYFLETMTSEMKETGERLTSSKDVDVAMSKAAIDFRVGATLTDKIFHPKK